MGQNTIKVIWSNPKPSSIEVVNRKKDISDYNPEGKSVKKVRIGEVQYVDWNLYQFNIAMDKGYCKATRAQARGQINKRLLKEIGGIEID
tara:strand:+ start:574 stop:843 length:270 start_codon:yes stop_codon:yes gene_type:complete